MQHLAIDLGGKESQICVRDAKEQILEERRLPTKPSVPTSLETVVPRYLSTDGRRMVLKTCPSQPKFQVERPPPPRATASRANPA
jgi:hypothetical protein